MKRLLFAFAFLAFAATAHATVPNATMSVTYTPGVPTSAFAVTFSFDSSSDLDVVKELISTGTETPLTEGADYTVAMPLGSHQGVVNTTSSIGSGWQVIITRGTALTQTSAFRTQGRYSPAVHEAALDKLTMITQELAVGVVSATNISNAITSHEGLSNPHTGYHLTLGLLGGQYATGGTAASENLTLRLTSHATKGKVILGSASAYDEVNNRLGIGTTSPSYAIDVQTGGGVHIQGGSGSLQLNAAYAIAVSDTHPLVLSGYDATGLVPGATINLYSSTHATKPYYVETVSDDLTVTDSLANELLHLTASGMTLTDVSVLTLDDSTAGGTLYGGTGTGEDITIKPNSAAANGTIFLGASSGFVESATPQLGIGTTAPSNTLEVRGQITGARDYTGFGAAHTASDDTGCNGIFTTSTSDGVLALPVNDNVDYGCEVTLFNVQGAIRVKMSPTSVDTIYGSCGSVGVTPVVDKDIWNTAATAINGDSMTVTKCVSKGWCISACTGIWASEP